MLRNSIRRWNVGVVLYVGLVALSLELGGLRAALAQARLLQAGEGGAVRALVVGVDEYPSLSRRAQLDGAVADARDIYTALTRAGVTDAEFLTNQNVTRTAFVQAIEGLIERAKPGDLVIITFAGHGSQELEDPRDSNSAKFESFILSQFDPSVEAKTLERIKDQEVFGWLGRLDAKGAKTIFLADSCHGGGMSKALEDAPEGTKFRSLMRVYSQNEVGPNRYYIPFGQDLLASIPTGSSKGSVNGELATSYYASVTFLAAVDALHEVPEIAIDNQPARGALSFAFARAIEADDLPQAVTRADLLKFVYPRVLSLTHKKQEIVFEPSAPDTAHATLFRKTVNKLSQNANAQPPQLANSISSADVIPSEARATLGQSGGAGTAVGVALQKLSARKLTMNVTPLPAKYSINQQFNLKFDGLYHRVLVLVNVAGDGEVQFLFPEGNANPLIIENTLDVAMVAKPPFGTDTLIALALKRRQPSLEFDLANLNGKKQPDELIHVIKKYVSANDLIGVASYQTSR